MLVKQLIDRESYTYTYLLADPESGEAVIIDPVVAQVDRDTKLIRELGLDLIYTLDTHVHADHITGTGELRRRLGAISAASAQANIACVEQTLMHGDIIRFGQYEIKVLATPGHTKSCLSFVTSLDNLNIVFTGDALLVRGCGRTDFQGGDSKQLYNSVKKELFSLPFETIVYPGHDYRGYTYTTIGEEKRFNPRLKSGVSENDFVQIMAELKLDNPNLMDEVIKTNLNCGNLRDSLNQSEVNLYVSGNNISQLENRFIVDVREAEEFNSPSGHLFNSVLVPLESLRRHARTWPRDMPILVVCKSGRRSQDACRVLIDMGFADVVNLRGGMMGWDGPVEVTQC